MPKVRKIYKNNKKLSKIQQVKVGQIEFISIPGEKITRCDLPQWPGYVEILWLLQPGS